MYNFQDVYQYSKDLDILYVEDNLTLLNEVSEILKDFFRSVTTAEDGLQGVEKYLSYKQKTDKYFDLVITDINMPKLDGLGMIKEIRQNNMDQVAIVVSAYNESSRLLDLIHEGIDNFLLKPIEPKGLIQILHKTCQNISNAKYKKEFLFQQSRLAQMGEIIDSIAHQWLQPIGIIKMQTNKLELDNIYGLINDKIIDEYIKKQSNQIDFMVETLTEFRKFLRPNSDFEIISYTKIVKSVLLLLDNHIMKEHIKIVLNMDDSHKVKIMPNEFKHILINIIYNTIDAFNSNSIDKEKRELIFTSSTENSNTTLTICDNAGGVPNNLINKIFDLNFSTKSKEKGTGMGLYMSLLIVEKNAGEISVKNKNEGACFKLVFKLEDN